MIWQWCSDAALNFSSGCFIINLSFSECCWNWWYKDLADMNHPHPPTPPAAFLWMVHKQVCQAHIECFIVRITGGSILEYAHPFMVQVTQSRNLCVSFKHLSVISPRNWCYSCFCSCFSCSEGCVSTSAGRISDGGDTKRGLGAISWVTYRAVPYLALWLWTFLTWCRWCLAELAWVLSIPETI